MCLEVGWRVAKNVEFLRVLVAPCVKKKENMKSIKKQGKERREKAGAKSAARERNNVMLQNVQNK